METQGLLREHMWYSGLVARYQKRIRVKTKWQFNLQLEGMWDADGTTE